MGVKEVPVDKLLQSKAYMFFSHTHKGQRHNLPLLRACMEKDIDLVDYELLTDEQGRRLVAFGRYAGVAGALNGLHGLGVKLLRDQSVRTPFLNISLAHTYSSTQQAKSMLKELDYSSTSVPVVIVVTGSGSVSKGAMEVLECLGHEKVSAKELPNISKPGIYVCHVDSHDYLSDGQGKFSFEDYLKNPQKYKSTFEENITPYATLLINGIYWESKYPRLLTEKKMGELERLECIADITCDIGGSVEATSRASTIDEPFFYVPKRNGHVQMMSIDNLPAQLPLDASRHFSEHLTPVLQGFTAAIDESEVMKRAVITRKQQVQSTFEPLLGPLLKKGKKFVIFGSGYVTGPTVEYLCNYEDTVGVVMCTHQPEQAQDLKDLLRKRIGPRADLISIQPLKLHEKIAHGLLDPLVAQGDIAISLLPAAMHPWIAKACLRQERHLVTASYISPDMQALHAEAEQRGLRFVSEIGLDPGLDHLAAMEIIDREVAEGREIVGFESWCGGLPAPAAADNPFGYRFSWSPKGVLLAALNEARYKEHGRDVFVKDDYLLRSYRHLHGLWPALNLQGIPNRDSLAYIQRYGLPAEPVQTMLRGTLRYAGFFDLVEGLRQLGFLFKTRFLPTCRTWQQVCQMVFAEKDPRNFNPVIREFYEADGHRQDKLIEAMQWLGMFSPSEAYDPSCTLLDNLCLLMTRRMSYTGDQRDAVYLHHTITSAHGNTQQRVVTKAALQVYGTEEWSAMARTVGLPVAMAVRLVAQGDIPEMGVLAPVSKHFYKPILSELARDHGIKFTEDTLIVEN